MALTLYNSANRKKDLFIPQDPSRVTLYVCGPTVYNFAHIGNARPPVVFDVLTRLLRHLYGADAVVYARNITDIDDKIMAKAVEEGTDIAAISARYEEAYLEDMGALGVAPPDLAPHATEHLPQMIAMIEGLVAKGHAYAAEGHVLFDVSSYANYGDLSGRDMDEMIAGARVEVAPYKRNPADFVLWKPSADDQAGWESPWGRGRPGWHIECSAMIETHLGRTIDIHGGGQDLQFPHHENELAQSCCAHDGAALARIWMHNGFLNMNAEKMSKSLGNVVLARELLADWPGEAIRFVLLSAHYRQPLDWTLDAITQAKSTLDRLYRTLEVLPGDGADASPHVQVLAALEDDLNTPKALAALSQLANAAQSADDKAVLIASAALLGLLQEDPKAWREGRTGGQQDGLSPADIDSLITDRAQAKQDRDFAKADAIRDALDAQGIVLEDSSSGTNWRKK